MKKEEIDLLYDFVYFMKKQALKKCSELYDEANATKKEIEKIKLKERRCAYGDFAEVDCVLWYRQFCELKKQEEERLTVDEIKALKRLIAESSITAKISDYKFEPLKNPPSADEIGEAQERDEK